MAPPDMKIALVEQKIDDLKEDVNEIKKILNSNYVTQKEFTPVRNLMYGLVGLILASVFGALLTLVLRR